jgi:hypothetical protein
MQYQEKIPKEGTATRKIFDVMSHCAALIEQTGANCEVLLGEVLTRGGEPMRRQSVSMTVSKMQAEFTGVRFYLTSKKLTDGKLYIGCRKC